MLNRLAHATCLVLLLFAAFTGSACFSQGFLQMGLDGVAWENGADTGPLLFRLVNEPDLVSVRAKISAQTQGNWSQSGVIVRAPNAIDGAAAQENWQTSWSFRPAGDFIHQSNAVTAGAEAELNDAGLTDSALSYVRLDRMGPGQFLAYRGSGPDDSNITWTPHAGGPQTNANLSGIQLQVGVAAGAIGALAGASVAYDWVEIQTTSQTFRDDFTATHDFTSGVPAGGIWNGVENAAAGGTPTRAGNDIGRCLQCTWNINGSGNFNAAGNWAPAILFAPNGNNVSATFGPALTAASATVYTNTNVTLKEINFDNTNTFALAGPGSITLDADAGNALISVLQGSHEIQVDLVLNDNVTATAAAGTALNINAPVHLNGRTFTVSAGSTVNLNNGTVSGGAAGAGQLLNDGSLSGLSSLAGDLVQSGSGSLVVDVGGAPVQVAGAAALSGVLEVSLADGFVPAAGTVYPVLTAGSVTDLGLSLGGADAGQFRLVVGSDSVSLLAAAIPEPATAALLTIGAAAAGIALRRRRPTCSVAGGARVVRSRTLLSSTLLLAALAASSAWAQTVIEVRRDDFGNDAMPHSRQHDYTTGMVPAGGIWTGIHNPKNGGDDAVPALFVADGTAFDGTDKAGKLHAEDLALHLNSNGMLGTGWEPQGDKNNSPFLFTTVDVFYDFNAIVKIDSQTAGNWSQAGIIARVAGPPVGICCGQDEPNSFTMAENFVTVGSFRPDAANPGNASLLLQNAVDGGSGGGGSPGEVNTELAPTGGEGGLPIWIRVQKRGGSVFGASSVDGVTWVEPANALVVNPNLTRTQQGQAMLEVGLSHHSYVGGVTGFADFDFFEVEILGPSTPTDAAWTPAGGSGNWNAVGNWTVNVPGTIPNQNTINVTLGSAATAPATVFNNAAVMVKSLTFNNANKHAIAGTGSLTLQADSGTSSINVEQGSHEIQLDLALGNDTTTNVAAGSRLEINNSLDFLAANRTLTVTGAGRVDFNNNIDTTSAGIVTVNGGNVGGNGRVNGRLTNNGGTVSPGIDVGTLTVESQFLQNAAGTLNIELGGTAATLYDRLRVEGGFGAVANLDGTLDVSLVNGFVPAVGNTFDVVTSTGGIISSNVISLHASDAPFYSLAVVSGNILRLTATAVPMPGIQGDFNNNGVVDAADYVLWRDGGTLQNDPTPGVQPEDYNVWRANFGRTGGSGSAAALAAVPEPTSGVLLMIFAVGMYSARRR